MNRILLIVALLILVILAQSAAHASPWSHENMDCGRPFDGIQLCLSSAGSDLRLAFTNVGPRDVILNLGIMLANGKVQLPTNIALKFTDAQNKTRLFKFAAKTYIAGRVDDYVVPLRVGSTYTLQLTLDQFWCRETKEFSIPLTSGDNYLTAQSQGTGANAINLDTPGIKLMNFWLGKVESNTLTLHVN